MTDWESHKVQVIAGGRGSFLAREFYTSHILAVQVRAGGHVGQCDVRVVDRSNTRDKLVLPEVRFDQRVDLPDPLRLDANVQYQVEVSETGRTPAKFCDVHLYIRETAPKGANGWTIISLASAKGETIS